jgi:hypothetical protein
MAEVKLLGFAICRRASDYLITGFVTGFDCRVCGEPLQVSPTSYERIKDGSIMPMCNPCGFAMEKRLRDAGACIAKEFSPEAAARLEELAAEINRGQKHDRAGR